MKRRRVNKYKDKRKFSRTADKAHSRNYARPTRGGYRI